MTRLDSMEIQLGMVGPLSFAEETQTLVHETRGLQLPKGWDNQLGNEPGLVLIYEQTRPVGHKSATFRGSAVTPWSIWAGPWAM